MLSLALQPTFSKMLLWTSYLQEPSLCTQVWSCNLQATASKVLLRTGPQHFCSVLPHDADSSFAILDNLLLILNKDAARIELLRDKFKRKVTALL